MLASPADAVGGALESDLASPKKLLVYYPTECLIAWCAEPVEQGFITLESPEAVGKPVLLRVSGGTAVDAIAEGSILRHFGGTPGLDGSSIDSRPKVESCYNNVLTLTRGYMPFVKKLTKMGNSTGVILDRPILQQVDIEPDAEVEVSVENNAIVIRPHRYASDDDARAAGRKVVQNRRRLLERLSK